MAAKLSQEALRVIQEQGYGLVDVTGGPRKQRYYTPDGREIYSIPALREWRGKDSEGNIIGGTRDSNLDKGWLLQPPEVPKMYCPHCDRWHDTQAEIDKCGKKKRAFDDKWSRKARKDYAKENSDKDVEITELKNKLEGLEELVRKLVEGGTLKSGSSSTKS